MQSSTDIKYVQRRGGTTRAIDPHIQQIRTDNSQSEDRTRRKQQPVVGKEEPMH